MLASFFPLVEHYKYWINNVLTDYSINKKLKDSLAPDGAFLDLPTVFLVCQGSIYLLCACVTLVVQNLMYPGSVYVD